MDTGHQCLFKCLPAGMLANLPVSLFALLLTHLTFCLQFYDSLSCPTGNQPGVLTNLSNCSVNSLSGEGR